MKVYVSELPKTCKECPCVKENLVVDMGTSWVDYYCKLQHKDNDHSWCYKLGKNLEQEYKKCPLISIADYTKQVRKEVVQDIREEVKKLIDKDFKLCNHEYANGYCYGLQYDLAKILEQMKGEIK